MVNESEADILRVPTPPQRRLSRSSIDLRDLEQQQLQQHDRVIHTDSAPSVIALENFYFKSCSKKSKAENLSSQQFNAKANFLDKPLDCFHMQLNNESQMATAIDAFTIESDNEDLARFIEDNYQYFRKQNNATALPTATATATDADKQSRSLQLQVCSDPDFFTLKNNIDCCDACINGIATTTCDKKIKSKKHKIAALSDSDFIVSFGSKSKKFTLKSKLPFKTMLNGKLPKAMSTNTGAVATSDGASAPTTTTATATSSASSSAAAAPCACDVTDSMVAANNTQLEAMKRKHKGLNNNLSKSLNGCHRGKHVETMPLKPKSIQRVLSEGNETSLAASPRTANSITHSNNANNNEAHGQSADASASASAATVAAVAAAVGKYDAIDMFVKLFKCQNNDKNSMLSDKFSYKFVVNAKELDDLRDSILDNYSTIGSNTSDSLHKLLATAVDCSAKSNVDNADQLVIVNHPTYDEHLVLNANANANADAGLHGSNVLVNNLVITSPPVTPKQLLSPKTINKEPVHHPVQPYFSYSNNHLCPNMLCADATSISMDMPDSRAPFEHLVSLRMASTATVTATTTTTMTAAMATMPSASAADTMDDFELKVSDSSNVHALMTRNVHGNGNMATEPNFIKNDLALTNNPRPKCDNFAGGLVPSTNNSRIRKPSVTYDINVINKSPDFNIDDICPQRNSYAARSGSTTSTSKSNPFT